MAVENIYQDRIDRLRHILSEKKLDTFLVVVDENRRYLSGYTGEDTQFDESAGALLITADRLVLATDSRYDLQAGNEAPLFEVVRYEKSLAAELPGLLKKLNSETLGFESVRLSYMQFEKIAQQIKEAGQTIKLVSTEDIVEQLRICKSEPEIEITREALEIAESVFERIVQTIAPGMTEKELAWEMEKGMREAGAESLSFPSIVAAGTNAALPHAIPGERKLKPGEPILFDWGARLNGYCSDISRTVVIGKPDETFKKVFQTVLDAQRYAIEAIRPGVSSKAVDAVAREYIEKQGFGGKFGHGLGHGTGLAIHEQPRLSPLKDTPLEPGMISTVEPGIYLADWGGVRLENMIVVREDGAEVLNRTDPGRYQV